MTLSDAAGLAILALHDRRLVAAILRAVSRRSTAEDVEALIPRLPDESVLAWACRAKAPLDDELWHREWRRLVSEADEQIECARKKQIGAVALGDPAYPPHLAAIADPPPVLWVRGHVSVLSEFSIGIVGSRAATPYAIEMARRISMDLAGVGVVIVSGLARGVDAAAHRGAVAAKGRTVGVLGCGLDRVYPAEHAALASEMQAGGAVVSEFPAGVPPLPHHFPMRNRIISGLSTAVVVVEAPEKSGSLITANQAAEQGRDVMVVPGLASAGRNRGGHRLIRDGAKLVESADDILQELNVACPRATPFPTLLETAEFTVDELALQTGEPPNVILAKLLELELAGQIQRVGGGRFARVLT